MAASLGRRLHQATSSMSQTVVAPASQSQSPVPSSSASAPFVPNIPVDNACEETTYISSSTTPMDIYDQLTPTEYMDVASWLVISFGNHF